jgi:hypothetical protein
MDVPSFTPAELRLLAEHFVEIERRMTNNELVSMDQLGHDLAVRGATLNLVERWSALRELQQASIDHEVSRRFYAMVETVRAEAVRRPS